MSDFLKKGRGGEAPDGNAPGLAQEQDGMRAPGEQDAPGVPGGQMPPQQAAPDADGATAQDVFDADDEAAQAAANAQRCWQSMTGSPTRASSPACARALCGMRWRAFHCMCCG